VFEGKAQGPKNEVALDDFYYIDGECPSYLKSGEKPNVYNIHHIHDVILMLLYYDLQLISFHVLT